MSKKSVAIRDPENAMQVVESWARLPKDARKRRAAKASQLNDRKVLKSLLNSYTLAFSKSGTDTSPRTLSAYWNGARRLLDWCADNGHKPHAVGCEEILRFVASMGHLSPKSRRLYLSGSKTLISALRWAGMGEGDSFVMENGEPIRVRDPDSAAVKADPYTVAEIGKLLKGANKRERALILLGADGGLRLAEMQSLKWEGVDSDLKQLKFIGKGKKAADVLATDRLIESLEAMRDGKSTNIFKVSSRRLQQIFTKRCQDAGVRPRGVHNLRHSCGTELYRITKDLLIVMRHLRHSSPVVTQIYAHIADSEYHEAVEALEEMVQVTNDS